MSLRKLALALVASISATTGCAQVPGSVKPQDNPNYAIAKPTPLQPGGSTPLPLADAKAGLIVSMTADGHLKFAYNDDSAALATAWTEGVKSSTPDTNADPKAGGTLILNGPGATFSTQMNWDDTQKALISKDTVPLGWHGNVKFVNGKWAALQKDYASYLTGNLAVIGGDQSPEGFARGALEVQIAKEH